MKKLFYVASAAAFAAVATPAGSAVVPNGIRHDDPSHMLLIAFVVIMLLLSVIAYASAVRKRSK